MLTQPEIVGAIHGKYLEAGADILETNTFNANAISMVDYGMESLAYELNVAGAALARRVADTFEATRGLLDGGADILLVETIFDTLNAKAALFAIEQYFERTGTRVPVMISGPITDASGRTLSGQTTEAFWTSMAHINPIAIGLNGALGADQLRAYVQELSRVADAHVSAHPNAGLPNAGLPNAGLPNAFGGYDETPEIMGAQIGEWARSGLIHIVGGCCGTTPAHIAAIAKAVQGVAPRAIPSWRLTNRDRLIPPSGKSRSVRARTRSSPSRWDFRRRTSARSNACGVPVPCHPGRHGHGHRERRAAHSIRGHSRRPSGAGGRRGAGASPSGHVQSHSRR